MPAGGCTKVTFCEALAVGFLSVVVLCRLVGFSTPVVFLVVGVVKVAFSHVDSARIGSVLVVVWFDAGWALLARLDNVGTTFSG